MLNRSLENQVRKYLGQSENLPENLAALLSAISASYDYYDKDRALLKRSIEISSTEMIELNNSLRRTNHELNQLFNNVGEVLYTIDTITNKIIQISSACEKLYGYTVAEFCADPQIWLNVMHPDDLHLAYEYSKELVKGMQVQNQCRIIRKDASIRWIESSIIPTLNTEGQLIRVDGVVRDITEKKKAEEEILLSSARLKKAQEVAHVGSWDLDFATAIAIWSDEACRIYGLLPTENKYTYEDWISFVHPGDLEYVLAEIKKSQVALTATSFEHRIIRKDGSIRWIHSECIYQYNAFGKPVGLHGITHDVTERKKTEQGRNLQFVIAKLLSQSTNMAEFMSNVLQAICENLNWNLATVWMVDESAEVLRYADCWHSPGEANTDFITSSSTFTFAKGSGIPGYVWQTGKTVWVEDVTLQENFLRAQLAAGAGLRAACIFPIQNEGKVMGVVEVLSHEIKELDLLITHSDLRLLQFRSLLLRLRSAL